MILPKRGMGMNKYTATIMSPNIKSCLSNFSNSWLILYSKISKIKKNPGLYSGENCAGAGIGAKLPGTGFLRSICRIREKMNNPGSTLGWDPCRVLNYSIRVQVDQGYPHW